MSYVDEIIEQVIAKNPNEPEFHQAVREVLDSIRVIVDANEAQFRRDALLERLVSKVLNRMPSDSLQAHAHRTAPIYHDWKSIQN